MEHILIIHSGLDRATISNYVKLLQTVLVGTILMGEKQSPSRRVPSLVYEEELHLLELASLKHVPSHLDREEILYLFELASLRCGNNGALIQTNQLLHLYVASL